MIQNFKEFQINEVHDTNRENSIRKRLSKGVPIIDDLNDKVKETRDKIIDLIIEELRIVASQLDSPIELHLPSFRCKIEGDYDEVNELQSILDETEWENTILFRQLDNMVITVHQSGKVTILD